MKITKGEQIKIARDCARKALYTYIVEMFGEKELEDGIDSIDERIMYRDEAEMYIGELFGDLCHLATALDVNHRKVFEAAERGFYRELAAEDAEGG